MGRTVQSELWPHQVEAVAAVSTAIGGGGRTSLIGACGIGKTRIGGAVAAALAPTGRVLVVLPTIELLVQTLHAYRAVTGAPLGTVVAVCSDPTISDIELLEGEPDIVVTTTADVLADTVRGRRRVTVLSTYASLPVVAAAHTSHTMREWDLAVIDEAHRTTGKADGPWKIVHHDAQVRAKRRLYMTATPRVATTSGDSAVSMDDEKIYGPVSWRLPFSRAISMGLLADYRVVVPVVTNEEIHRLTLDEHLAMRLGASSISPATLAGQIAVLRTMTDYGVRRAISYHHRVADARMWAATLPAAAGLMPGGPLNLWAGHVSGAQPPHLRRRVIARLAEAGEELAVVSNARVLSEGVDVPAVDAVVFSRPRRSAIDTIQAVGRALRTGGRRDKVATVVVPLLLGAGESPEAALSGSDWEPVWQVLRALRDHDDRLDEQLRLKRMKLGEGSLFEATSREVKLPAWLSVTGIDIPDRFARAITIRAVQSTAPSWDEYYGAARAYRQVHGNVEIPSTWITQDELRLGTWWNKQKIYYNAGELSEDRVALLEKLGIIWNQLDENWMRTYTDARRLKEHNGHLLVDENYVTPHGIVLANWFNAQRQRRRVGKLSDERIALLDEIGFSWNGVAARWLQRYLEAKDLYERRGSLLRLPMTSREAIWIEGQVASNRQGTLTTEQLQLLHEIGIDFRNRKEALWRNTFEELKTFLAESGTLNLPDDLKTVDGVRLSSWTRAQRARRKRGLLAGWQIELLDKVGFAWNPAQQKWNQRLAELEHFVTHSGHINIPSGAPLRWWLTQQRKNYRLGTLPDEAAVKLAAIDPSWFDEHESLTSDRTRRFFRLTDQSWAAIEPLLPNSRGETWTNNDHRRIVETIIWKLRTGAPWDAIDITYGSPTTVQNWHFQWERDGIWAKIDKAITLRARSGQRR
jgi:superfamily II DNA or RNA helicase/transposase